ncbi:hypothetical protein OG2516_03173 [Oceanicola granulosus HTCC2516]|uniref:PpiC domain-containing protein n=1 Tax=Oceanicola granulosus (strain ATCC BAA-861 / DSM 15982 / KCTC 12143 / HTCC2516) TaxID=314256 RepID=Q2CE91_OCEGH|nr:peptidylprolyl isomerase [Oceanicola granulosus]EAR50969.1 hypothetical protein OG2516_03173 [Oceanicola granulosus HTCC2516]
MAKNSAKTVATWVILGLLFFGLIGFGATGLSGNVRTLGSVGEKEIAIQDYARELNRQINQLQQQTGQTLTFSEVEQFGIDRMVLSSLISRRTLDNEAAELGLSAGDGRVAAEVRASPAFQGLDGSFDREGYKFALDRNGLTEGEYESEIREQLARGLLQRAVVAAIPESDTYADVIAAYLGETRSFVWAELDEDDLAEPIPEPTDAELQAYYEANLDAFTRPETREITYAALTPDMILDDVEVDRADLQALYDERIDDYVRPERRLVERLIFPDEDAAAAALARIESGESDFDSEVRARGLDLADIDLGDVAQDRLGAAGEAVFAARPGDVVGPHPTDLGPALFRMNAVLPAQEVPLEEAEADLRVELAADVARRRVQSVGEEIADLIAGGATLEDLSERTDLELGTLTYTDDSRDGLAAYAAFRAEAASARPEDFPELVELEDGGIFALRVDEVREPAPIPLEETREAVAAAWREAQRSERLLARAEEMAATIEETGRFTDQMPAPIAEIGVDRRAVIGGTPPGFVAQVFEMEEGEARAVETESGAIVVQLRGTRAAYPDNARVAADAATLAERAQGGVVQDIFDVFTRAVQTSTEVRLDQSAVEAVNATFR